MIPTSWLYKILAGALALAALMWLIQSRDHWRDTARANEQLYLQEKAAHAATVANYRAAAEQAKRADAANAARVKAEQSAINERTSNGYQSRLASVRAQLERMQRETGTAEANPGGRTGAPVPGLPTPTCGADEEADHPVTRAFDCAIQLDALIDWIAKQHEIEVNGNAQPSH